MKGEVARARGLEWREEEGDASRRDVEGARGEQMRSRFVGGRRTHTSILTSRGFYEERISGVTTGDLQIFTRNADVLPSSSSVPINETGLPAASRRSCTTSGFVL
ncbi:hypothetical protein KM043_014986 [Ampulex compressa]|nr:hypothetical protein KM043_014986 [Ampulex compressa]